MKETKEQITKTVVIHMKDDGGQAISEKLRDM